MLWLEYSINEMTPRLFSACLEAMTPPRRQEVLGFSREVSGYLSAAGEMLAKRAAAQLTGLPEETFLLHKDKQGKPFLQCRDSSFTKELYISIAHSGHLAVAAADFSPIGIDIEMRKTLHPQLHRRLCTPGELEEFHAAPDPNLYLLKVWTAKEAFFKKEGTGITRLQSVDTRSLRKEYFLSPERIICIVQ